MLPSAVTQKPIASAVTHEPTANRKCLRTRPVFFNNSIQSTIFAMTDRGGEAQKGVWNSFLSGINHTLEFSLCKSMQQR